MGEIVFKKEALERIKNIHRLSKEYNQRTETPHFQKLFHLIEKHAKEIQELFKNNDNHFIIETGDLAILCFEVILEAGVSVEKILLKCFERYEKKLKI